MYTPISDPICDVHWLVRRKIGSAVRGCAKLVDIRMLNIENDGLMTSLVYCAIYAQLLVLRALGGAWYYTSSSSRGGATSSALKSLILVHHASMDPCRSVGDGGMGGGRVPTASFFRGLLLVS